MTSQDRKPLRLWPGVVAVALQWLLRYAVPAVYPEGMAAGMIGSLVLTLFILVWWLFLSRAPRFDRWGILLLIVLAMAATRQVLHPSIAGGMMGMMFWLYAIPVMCLALVGGAVLSRNLADLPRRATFAAAVLIACGVFTLLRTDGITGEGQSQFAWRWKATAEQQLLARTTVVEPLPPEPAKAESAPLPVEKPSTATPPTPPKPAPLRVDWPGFRGPNRDGVVHGLRINTDWASSRPIELWRRPVGPGWSSFAAGGGLIFTQEQRGDFEVVSCYNASTGRPVWTHRDSARFWESNGGAGPRGTPTLHDGRIYTVGATGIVNALDARTGARLWTKNAASDTGAKLPGWGFSSSPLVVDNLVIVAASGRLASYDAATGDLRWTAQGGGGSYSSPHLVSIDGVEQVVMLTGAGATSFSPAEGRILWKHSWEGSTILQPALAPDGGVLITTGDASGGLGTRRLAIAHGPAEWTTQEVWTSRGLKPYFNDLVVHNGYAFGFDGSILSCIDLKDGARKWKGGRYGHGQLLLLADQDVLLVLAEEGELALVRAAADQFTEIARMPAIEGKTWNHPALMGDVLLIRNGEEMAAFRLPAAGTDRTGL